MSAINKVQLTPWKYDVLRANNNDLVFADEDRQIIQGSVPDSLSLKFHQKMPKGAALRELSRQPLHLAYWDTPFYKKAIESYLHEVDKEKAIVADIGCGDGRFTEFLLELGVQKIIAAEIDLTPLTSLADVIVERGLQERVLLIHNGVEDLPLVDGVCDVVVSMMVLYYLNERFDDGLRELVRILKKGGVLVNCEPDLDGALYKSLIFEALEDVFENYFDRKFKEEKGETPFKFTVFSEKEINVKLEAAGLKVIDKYGVALFSTILRIMTLRGQVDRENLQESEQKVWDVLEYLNANGKLNKQIVWKSIKN